MKANKQRRLVTMLPIAFGRPMRWFLGLQLLVLLAANAQAGDLYELCGIDRQQFSKFAYPEGVPRLSERLVKWRRPPGLIILSPNKDFEKESMQLFDRVKADGFQAGQAMAFVNYGSPDELYEVTTKYGISNVFLIVDADGFSNNQSTSQLRQSVADVLLFPRLVDRLFSVAQRDQKYSIQSHISGTSSEVFSSVALLSPALDSKALSDTMYMLNYAAMSPPATYRVQDFLETMFVSPANGGEANLSEFAKAYYRVVLDADVSIGATPSEFGECGH